MAKFKVGDRVVVRKKVGNITGLDKYRGSSEAEGVVDEVLSSGNCLVREVPHDVSTYIGIFSEGELEPTVPRRPKVGDRVKVIGGGDRIGEVGMIEKDDGSGIPFKLRFENNGFTWKSVGSVELVERADLSTENIDRTMEEFRRVASIPGPMVRAGLDFGHGEFRLYGGNVSSNNNKSIMSTLYSKFRMGIKSEPEKSFIKKGIMNADESLTSAGTDLLLAFLISKFKDEFKKEVVDKIEVDKSE